MTPVLPLKLLPKAVIGPHRGRRKGVSEAQGTCPYLGRGRVHPGPTEPEIMFRMRDRGGRGKKDPVKGIQGSLFLS